MQLVLPYTRSRTAGRGHARSRKRKIFNAAYLAVGMKNIPCIFCEYSLSFNEATIEHIIPISKGGTNAMENLTISCKSCNNNRKSMPFDYWKKVAKFDKLFRFLIKSNKITGRCII